LGHPDLVSRLTLIEPVFFAAARGTPEHAARPAPEGRPLRAHPSDPGNRRRDRG